MSTERAGAWTGGHRSGQTPGVPEADPALDKWFLRGADGQTRPRTFAPGPSETRVAALVHGAEYFPVLHQRLCLTRRHDQVYFADFRADTEELLDGEGSAVGEVLGELARRSVLIFGLDLAVPARLAGSERGPERRTGPSRL